MKRRAFLKYAAYSVAGATVLGTGYSLFEAKWAHVVHERIKVSGIPSPFRGMTIALLTDLHHGPWTSLNYIDYVVRLANAAQPDLVLLGGDYCHDAPQYIEPCIRVLSNLTAPLGVYAVMGNHDHYQGTLKTRAAFVQCGIRELNNDGLWLELQGERLRLAGVDDFWSGDPRLKPALGDMRDHERCILLSHNPDFAETIRDPRVGLVLSGHTHGGQVDFPLIGAPIVHSHNEKKYLHGLTTLNNNLLFVSRGLGTTTPPVRFNCRPEINLIELV